MLSSEDGFELLKTHEGLRLTKYQDTKGVWTIGYGHNLEVEPTFHGHAIPGAISAEFASLLFRHDVEATETRLVDRFPWAVDLDEVRRDVVINMTFNMGIGKFPTKWPNFVKQLRAEDFAGAAANMLKTPWFAQVNPKKLEGRGFDLCRLMERGHY